MLEHRFRYSKNERSELDATLTAAQSARNLEPFLLTADDFSFLEDAARDYQWFYRYTDPGSDEVKKAKVQLKDVVKYSSRLLKALGKLDEIPTRPKRSTPIQIEMARDPLNASAEYAVLKEQLLAVTKTASRLEDGFPKSAKGGSNRSRSDVLNNYLSIVLMFCRVRGGGDGKSSASPAAKFILATAKSVVPKLTANTISQFIRDEAKRHEPL